MYGLNKQRRSYLSSPKFRDKEILTIDQFKVIPADQSRVVAERDAPVDLLVKYYIRHPKSDTLTDGSRGTHDTRSKCKAGIAWAVDSKRVVHFILDDIDMNQVVSKYGNEETRRITNSELRWVYRNRLRPSVINGIQFWFQWEQVNPPWNANCTSSTGFGPTGRVTTTIDTVSEWKKYKPKNTPGLIPPP